MRLPFIVLFSFSILLISSCETSEKKETYQNKKPNIIYILADDLGYADLSANGQQKFTTPNIDRLAIEGINFTSHYSGSTVCAPSRSVLMTGLHSGHTYIRGNREMKPEGQYPIPDSAKILPEYLKEAGYVTGAFGKWGLGSPGSSGDPVYQGFDKFYGYNCQRLAHNYYPEYLWNNQDTVFLTGNDNRGTAQYSHDLIQEEVLKFIDKNKDTTFFLYIPYAIPHAELLVPEDSIFEKFKDKYPEKPYNGYDEGDKYRQGPYGSQEMPHAAFAAMVTRMDLSVGQILDKLKEHNIDNNTIIMFTSDNGPHLEGGADPDFFDSNGVFRGFKRDLYEGGIRVPMFVRWPEKIKSGTKSSHISGFIDILPTMTEVVGIQAPKNIDGLSFLPTLTGQKQKKHEYMYWEFHEQGGKQAVRMENFKAVRKGVHKDKNAPIELYDLSKDPSETEDIAANNQEIVEKMGQIMETAHKENPIFKFNWEKSDSE